jgi:hypothetical protein
MDREQQRPMSRSLMAKVTTPPICCCCCTCICKRGVVR